MQSDEQAIRDLVETWLDASRKGDTRKVRSLMAQDAIFLQCGQPPLRGREAFATAQESLTDLDLEANCDIQEVKIFGEWAYVWTFLSVNVISRNGGGTVTRAGHTLSVLQKKTHGWVIFRDTNMLMVVNQ